MSILLGLFLAIGISGVISGFVIYTISILNIGIKVRNFLWAMISGVIVGILSNISSTILFQITGIDALLGKFLVNILANAAAIFLAGILFKEEFKVKGLGGALFVGLVLGTISIVTSSIITGKIASNSNVESASPSHVETINPTTESTNSGLIIDLRDKLVTNINMTIPETNESINFSGEEGKWSEGYVIIGKQAAELPKGAVVTTFDLNHGGNARDVYIAVFEPGENAWQMNDAKLLGEPSSNAIINKLYTESEKTYVTFSTYGSEMTSQADNKVVENNAIYTYLSGKLSISK